MPIDTEHQLVPVLSERDVRILQLTVLAGGFASIGVEIATSRLLAPYFGTSTFVWSNLIAATLCFLAIGYYAGGRLADRRTETGLLYGLCLVAALVIAILPFVSQPVLRASLRAFDQVDVGAFYGSLVAVLLLLAIPVTLLGFVTPFAIRLRLPGIGSAGQTSGGVYALSTVGSVAGSLLPAIILIPLVGTRATFLIIAALLAVPAMVGLGSSHGVLAASAATAIMVAVAGLHVAKADDQIKPPYRGELIEETESQYNYIQVLNDDGRILLALNEGHAIHSIYEPGRPLTGGPWDYFAAAPLFLEEFDADAIESSLFIGLAAGTGAHTMLASYDNLNIVGVEIDEEIVSAGNKFFAMADPRLQTVISDGRHYLNLSDERYDIIAIDAYVQPYIPFHLTTEEFFELAEEHLTDNGVVVINVGRTDTDYRLVDALSATMGEAFDHVYIVEAARYENSLVIATNSPSSLDAFAANQRSLEPDSTLAMIATESLASGNLRVSTSSAQVLTDDRAPIEWIVDQMIVQAARNEEIP